MLQLAPFYAKVPSFFYTSLFLYFITRKSFSVDDSTQELAIISHDFLTNFGYFVILIIFLKKVIII